MKLAVYDTGYGLSVAEDVGMEIPTICMLQHRFFKVQLPEDNGDIEAWEERFYAQKKILMDMVAAYNELNNK